MASFDNYDLTFKYPENWEISVDGSAQERTITVESPDSAFLVVTVFDELISPLAVIRQATDAFLEVYEDADLEDSESELLGFPCENTSIDFTSLDLVGQAQLLAFCSHKRTFFILSQRSDIDAETADDVFSAILASLRLPTE